MAIPEDKQYVWVEFIYMGKPAREAAKYLAESNCFIFDFYSGIGVVLFDEIIKWERREVKNISEHPWAGIEGGVV